MNLPRTAVVQYRSKFFGKKNLSLNSVHGRTLFNSATDGGGAIQKQVFGSKTRSSRMNREVHS